MSKRALPNAPPQYVRDTIDGNDLDAVTAEDFDAGELARDALNRRKPRRGNKRATARGHHGALPHELQQLLGESNIAYMEKRYPEALAACHAVITKLPSCGEAFALMGLIYEETGDAVRCADSYRLACAASPNDSAMWLRFSRSSGVVGRQSDAREALVRASKLAPEDLDLGMEAASLCVEAGDISRATFIYKRVLQHPRNTNPIPILLTLADLQLEVGNVKGLKDSLVDSVNWCMGVPLESMEGAVLEKQGVMECDDNDEEEGEEEGGGRGGQLVSSRFRVGDHLLCPRPELRENALNSANMLVQILTSQKEFKAASRVVERTHAYLAHLDLKGLQASKGSSPSAASVSTRASVLAALALLPLELVVRYGIAQVWLDDSLDAAGACFSQLWSVPPASAPELYAEVGVVLAETGKFSAALGVFSKLVQVTSSSVSGAGGESCLLLFPPFPSYTSGDWEGVCNFSSAFDAWEPNKWLLPLPGAPSLGSEDGADTNEEDLSASSPPYFNSDHSLFPLSIMHHFKKSRPSPSPLFKVFTSLALCHESLGMEEKGRGGGNGCLLDLPSSSTRKKAALGCLLAAVHVQPDLGVSLAPRLFALFCSDRQYCEAFGLLSSHTLTSRAHEDDIAVLLQGSIHYFNTLESGGNFSWSLKCGLLEASLGMGLPQCSLYARIKRLSGSVDYYGGGVEGLKRLLFSFKECITGAEKECCDRVPRFVFNLYSLVERVIEKDHYAAKAQRNAIFVALKGLSMAEDPLVADGGVKSSNAFRPPKVLLDLFSSSSATPLPESVKGGDGRNKRRRHQEMKDKGVNRRQRGNENDISSDVDFWEDCSDDDELMKMEGGVGSDAGGDKEASGELLFPRLATLQRLAAAVKKGVSSDLPGLKGAVMIATAAAQSLSDLALDLRGLAQGYPYDVGIWSLYRVVEARAQWASLEVKSLTAAAAASSISGNAGEEPSSASVLPMFTSSITITSFRRAILRSHLLHTSSTPLLLLVASESMHFRSSFRCAVGAFNEATRLHPRETTTRLGSGAAHFDAVFFRPPLHKHTHSVKGLLSLSKCVLTEDVGGCMKGESDTHPLHLTGAPFHLPPSLKAAESSFNSGRAAHQLGFPDLAIQFYSGALRFMDEAAPIGGGVPLATPWEARGPLDLRRESAFNLTLLLKDTGDAPKALEVTLKYLSYD